MLLDIAFGGTSDAVHDCHVDESNPKETNTFEMKQFRKENFDRKFLDECLGKELC